MQRDYHFISTWRVTGEIASIYRTLKEGSAYSRWWSAYRETCPAGPNKVRATVRALLPYSLRFVVEVIDEKPPHEILLQSTGDLAGTGRWVLRQEGEQVEIRFYWDVRIEKPILRWFSPLLRPFLKWNHDWVMRTGEAALQREVLDAKMLAEVVEKDEEKRPLEKIARELGLH